jgi:hypothetical protein
MALISTREVLVDCLRATPARECAHVWLTSDGSLVVGDYPSARARFDFAAEQFAGCTGDHEADSLAPFSSEKEAETAQTTHEKKRISLIHEAPRWTQTIEIETPDCIYVVGSATRALITGLELIEDVVPGTLELLAREKGRSKRPVSRVRGELYDLASQAKYSQQLKNGYWVGTNNKTEEAMYYLMRATKLARLDGEIVVRRKESKQG